MSTRRHPVLLSLGAVCAIMAVSPLLAGRMVPAGGPGAGAAAGAATPGRPNILFVMADDHAAHAIARTGRASTRRRSQPAI